jgi:hypothetical protein
LAMLVPSPNKKLDNWARDRERVLMENSEFAKCVLFVLRSGLPGVEG